jgi:hypothetical protein
MASTQVTRDVLAGHTESLHPSGDMAYRCMIKVEYMKQYPKLKEFMQDSSNMSYWIGTGQHAIC